MRCWQRCSRCTSSTSTPWATSGCSSWCMLCLALRLFSLPWDGDPARCGWQGGKVVQVPPLRHEHILSRCIVQLQSLCLPPPARDAQAVCSGGAPAAGPPAPPVRLCHLTGASQPGAGLSCKAAVHGDGGRAVAGEARVWEYWAGVSSTAQPPQLPRTGHDESLTLHITTQNVVRRTTPLQQPPRTWTWPWLMMPWWLSWTTRSRCGLSIGAFAGAICLLGQDSITTACAPASPWLGTHPLASCIPGVSSHVDQRKPPAPGPSILSLSLSPAHAAARRCGPATGATWCRWTATTSSLRRSRSGAWPRATARCWRRGGMRARSAARLPRVCACCATCTRSEWVARPLGRARPVMCCAVLLSAGLARVMGRESLCRSMIAYPRWR